MPKSSYYVRDDVLRPYRPPICHREFGFSPPPQPGLLGRVFGGHNNDARVAVGASQVAFISLRNTDGTSLESKPYNAAKLTNTPGVIDEPFAFPLARDLDELPTDALNLRKTKLILEFKVPDNVTDDGKFAAEIRSVTIKVKTRTEEGDAAEIPVDAFQHGVYAGGVARFVFELADLEEDLEFMGVCRASVSPYAFVATATASGGATSTAWTFAHVPHQKDVRLVEKYATTRAIFMGDDLASLLAAGNGIAKEACTEHGLASLNPTKEEIKGLNDRVEVLSEAQQIRGLPAMREELRLTEGQIVRLREVKARLSTHPQEVAWIDEGLVVGNLSELREKPAERPGAVDKEISSKGVRVERLRPQIAKLEERERALQQKGVVIPTAEEAALENVNRYGNQNLNIMFPRGDGEARRSFAHLSWASMMIVKRGDDRNFRPVSLFAAGDRPLIEIGGGRYLKRVRTEPVRPDEEVAARIIEHDVGGAWKRYDFAADCTPLSHAITYAISSCAFGVTFPDVAEPDIFFVWHINNSSKCPLKLALSRFLSEGENADRYPTWRTIVSVFPQVHELKEDRPSELYPDAILAAAKTVFLARESNLYDVNQTTTQAHAAIGLTFGNGVANIKGTYGHETPTDYIMDAQTLLWKQTTGCGCAQGAHDALKTKIDFDRNIFGTGKKVAENINDAPKLSRYAAQMKAYGTRQSSDIPRGLKEWVAGQWWIYTIPAVGRAAFNAIDGASTCKPVIEANAFLICEKAHDELGADMVV